MPDIVISPILATFFLQHPKPAIIPAGKKVKNPAGCTAPQPEAWLFDFDPRVLDHLAPALFLAAHIPIKLLRGTRDMTRPSFTPSLLNASD